MKSFLNVIPTFQTDYAASAWQPEELAQADSDEHCADVEAILSIFRTADLNVPKDAKKNIISPTSAWQPDELFQQFVFDQEQPISIEYHPPALAVEALPIGPDLVEEAENAANLILEQARAQGDEIMLQAQRTADDMIAEAEQEIEELKIAGYRKGMEDARAEAQSYLQAALAIHTDVNTWKEDVLSQVNPMIVEMVKDIAQKMFGQGVELSDQALQHNLNRVLTNVKSLGDINIYLNPRDAVTIDSGWREMRSSITGGRIQIIPSGSITPGGCFVEGEMGSIDGRVETQLKVVLDTLSGTETDSDPDEE